MTEENAINNAMRSETIFALSSGMPPAAIALIRISGPDSRRALELLTKTPIPAARRATLRLLKHPLSRDILDKAVILWFPGPDTATGEDLVELHLHGGRAVVRAVESALGAIDGLRKAEAGEFTRRAFVNGRMDLAEAEGLSDLLFAETEWQRRAAITQASGQFSQAIEIWREQVLGLSALVEAELDFSDEDDVSNDAVERLDAGLAKLSDEIAKMLDRPMATRLHDGIRVVLAGPPNSGKSTLLNALVQREAAIVSDIAGTTRDVIETPIAMGGIPFVFMDTAGLRIDSDDPIETIGIERAHNVIASADIVLWLGEEGQGPEHQNLWEIAPRCDASDAPVKRNPKLRLSAKSGENLPVLVDALISVAQSILPPLGEVAINERQRHHIADCHAALCGATDEDDMLIKGEYLRQARRALDGLLGRTHTEDMLDALFGRFCIGK